jgi:hypothetical protein
MTKQPDPNWTDALTAIAATATAILTLAIVVMAVAAWRVGKKTLEASIAASTAATASADAARVANEQAKRDSIEQTRPFVYAELVPSLAGNPNWDVRIVNVGRSSARNLTLSFDNWPDEPDDVATSVRDLFDTPRTLPPSASIRAMWRLEGNFDDGTSEAGMGKSGTITVSYTSDDPTHPRYEDVFDVRVDNSGLWPVSAAGPTPSGMTGDALKFYRLAQVATRHLGDLNR